MIKQFENIDEPSLSDVMLSDDETRLNEADSGDENLWTWDNAVKSTQFGVDSEANSYQVSVDGNGYEEQGIIFEVLEFLDLSQAQQFGLQLDDYSPHDHLGWENASDLPSVRVADIIAHSTVDIDGRLKSGDYIFEINNNSLKGLCITEVR